ncbi:MAG: amidohydrolase [Planctomycetaceae bacterium]|nr:amidohydrolase [Planctomycetales bacterium]MCB9936636.1 amidohydrolase [Planctomycetaceae bacterium]
MMPTDWRDFLDQAIDDRFSQLVAIRRHLHAHPELSGQERDTSLYLYQLLSDLHFDVRMGPEGCGLIVDDRSKPAVSRVAIRADIDALHIHDAKQVDYRSQNEGVMHACGHDAHTATVFGAITALKALQASGELPWDVSFRGIFQPAEETCAGATSMIQAGALEDVSSLIAVHMDPTRRVGHVGFRAGVLTANCDEMEIVISGRGGHAARPHEASDPIAAAAQLVNALYLFIPRVTDSQDAVVVTIGKIDGGDHANVIPERVTLRGTIRTLDQVVRRKTMEHISRIASSVAQTSETKINVQFGLGCKSVVNDAKVVQILRLAARDVLEPAGVEEIPRPSMGSEDFAFYLEQVPGAMIRLGSTSDRVGGSGLHTPTFDIDEESLRIGARILARSVVYLADPDRERRLEENQASGVW